MCLLIFTLVGLTNDTVRVWILETYTRIIVSNFLPSNEFKSSRRSAKCVAALFSTVVNK